MIQKTLRQTLKILLILFIAAAVVCGLWFIKKDSVAGIKYYHFDTAAFDDKCEQLSDASKAKDAAEVIRLYDEPDNHLTDTDCIDLAEIASNGFEGLMTNYYDEIFPDQADSARHEIIDELMENILYGCIQDEFQREVYRDPDMTLKEMNRLYARIYKDYGIDPGPEDYSWVFVTHMFEVPMYNISYAVSGLAAMQIWSRSETDFDGAVSIWEKFLDEGIYNRSYLEVVERCGLEKFTEPGAVEAICKPALDAFR